MQRSLCQCPFFRAIFITSATKSALAGPDMAGSVTPERNGQFEPCGARYESFVNGGRITSNVFSRRLPDLSGQPALARPSIDTRDATALRTALRRNSRIGQWEVCNSACAGLHLRDKGRLSTLRVSIM